MKQETLEEAAERYVDSFEHGIAHPRRVCKNAFINGAKWKQERMYSEEDMKQAFHVGRLYLGREGDTNFEQFIEEFKKK